MDDRLEDETAIIEEASLSSPPPDVSTLLPQEERYLLLLTKALNTCAVYKPKFGQGANGLTLADFQSLYGSDPFYKWIGLDSPLMYAAHKAAGGMTSIYRQLGIGTQWILNQIMQDHLGLTKEAANWNYQVPSAVAGKARTLALDGRIRTTDIQEAAIQKRVQDWLDGAMNKLLLSPEKRDTIRGAVFEARQGYKSKDSKRQNGDIANAANAYAHSYIPVLLLFSNQLDESLAERYARAQWLILRGTMDGSALDSTYVFCRDVIGYDLAGFFDRNSAEIKARLEETLKALLIP